VAEIQIITCPECSASIEVTVRDDGEVSVVGCGDSCDPLEMLEEV